MMWFARVVLNSIHESIKKKNAILTSKEQFPQERVAQCSCLNRRQTERERERECRKETKKKWKREVLEEKVENKKPQLFFFLQADFLLTYKRRGPVFLFKKSPIHGIRSINQWQEWLVIRKSRKGSEGKDANWMLLTRLHIARTNEVLLQVKIIKNTHKLTKKTQNLQSRNCQRELWEGKLISKSAMWNKKSFETLTRKHLRRNHYPIFLHSCLNQLSPSSPPFHQLDGNRNSLLFLWLSTERRQHIIILLKRIIWSRSYQSSF